MKKLVLITAVLATFAIASCGGSSGTTPTPGPTPTPTNDNTKAVSDATIAATNAATSAAVMNGLTDTGASTMNNSLTGKEAIYNDVNYTYNCTEGGTVLATGTMTASCEGDDNWSCTDITLNLALQFNDCTETVTVDSTDYTVMLNGNGASTASGTASGNDAGPTSMNVSATVTGTLDATGDATGTVVLDLDVIVSGAPTPSPTCSGTASVTTDAVTEVCGVTSDCSGCEA